MDSLKGNEWGASKLTFRRSKEIIAGAASDLTFYTSTRSLSPLAHSFPFSTPQSGSSGQAQTPVAWCVTLIQYWHKGGGLSLRVCVCVCWWEVTPNTHTKWIILTNAFSPSKAPPPSSSPCRATTFVPALNCKRVHCNVATCQPARFVSFSVCVGIIFILSALQITFCCRATHLAL